MTNSQKNNRLDENKIREYLEKYDTIYMQFYWLKKEGALPKKWVDNVLIPENKYILGSLWDIIKNYPTTD